MQKTIVDILFLGFFVFLFAALSLARKDLRHHFWLAGWLCVFPHFAVHLWQPSSTLGQLVQGCISADALALAGTCFILSVATTQPSNRMGKHLGPLLVILTLLALNLAIIGKFPWLLAAVVAARQITAVALTGVVRHLRRSLALCITALIMISAIWMFEGLLGGRPEVVVYAILGEIFFVAAADFWTSGWERSLALYTITAGLCAWGAVFPLAYTLSRIWPGISVDAEFWNMPKLCAAMGMILVVLEEDNRAARALTEDYRLLFQNNPNPMWIFETASLCFLDVNQSTIDVHGYSRDEFLRMKLTDVLAPEIIPLAIQNLGNPEPLSRRASRHICKDGAIVPMDITSYSITFHGKHSRFVTAVDATERENLQQQLDRQAGKDQLTGLPNRLLLSELLSRALRRAVEGKEKLAVLSLDIDRFKRVNDFYGLRVGDEYIKRIAAALSARMRSMDIVARTGGDEFAIVLTGLKSSFTAEQTVSELMELFAQPLIVQGYKIQLGVSIGVAIGPDDGSDPVALWRGAESARNQAKAAGSGHVLWLSPELNRAAEEQVELEAYLRSHLNDGGFRLVYQPLYAMDGSVHALEALLRLDHPTLGPISPVRLIPIAEESGLIVPLGQWIIEEVCRQLLVWSSQGVPIVPVAINASGLELMHEDFGQRLIAMLERYSIDPHMIHVEVTESAAMRNVDEVSGQMTALSAQGIVFSIDDFGTGYSSFARLAQLGASILKIDRSFMNADCTQHAHSIVQAIITMAHALGRVVVAEGVETSQQVDCLRELGCDLLQGFLLSRPVAPERIPALIATPHSALTSACEDCAADSLHLVAHAGD
jgi:diguanylate cyclase (GGDEF)-like protein/PAS domain S-box-containing protein